MAKKKTKAGAVKTSPADECIGEMRDALDALVENRALSIPQYIDALEEVKREIEFEIEMLLDAARTNLKKRDD